MELTAELGSPRIFCKWAAIAAIAAALERKVWMVTARRALYPNLYTILVGPPGVGKTLLTAEVYNVLKELDGHHIASSSVTRASLIDELNDAARRIIRPDAGHVFMNFNALAVVSNEFGTLIPAYETDIINALTDIYDCKPYSERRRTKDRIVTIESPQLNLLAATTPSYLRDLLPEGAWDQGFISRVIMVYSGESEPQPLFDEFSTDDRLYRSVINDLQIIGDLIGEATFSEEAKGLISQWHMNRGEPRPDHPKLIHYNTRRTAHLAKLCLIASVSRSDSLVIEAEDFQLALDWLTEVESFMPDIFKAMTTGGDSRVIQEAWHFVYQMFMKGQKKAVPEYRLVQFLQERVPAHRVSFIIETMERAQLLRPQLEPKIGKAFVPRARTGD